MSNFCSIKRFFTKLIAFMHFLTDECLRFRGRKAMLQVIMGWNMLETTLWGLRYTVTMSHINFRVSSSALAMVPSRRYHSLAGYGTVKSWRSRLSWYHSRRGYGRIKTVSVSVTRLVLTPTLTLNDPLSQDFTTKWHGHFKITDNGNGNVYANYHR